MKGGAAKFGQPVYELTFTLIIDNNNNNIKSTNMKHIYKTAVSPYITSGMK